MSSQLSRVRRALGERLAQPTVALVIALLFGAAPTQAQQAPDFTVLSVYVEDANGTSALQPDSTINLVLIANNKGEGTARNARVRVELRSAGVSFVDDPSARTRELVLGDFGGRVSEQVFVPIVANARTGSIDLVLTPLYDGQRGAPVPQPHRFPTGFPGTTAVAETPQSSRQQPAATPAATPASNPTSGAVSRPAAGARLSRAQILALPVDPERMLSPNGSVSGTLGRGNFLLDDGTPVAVWYYEGKRGERVTITQTSSAFDSFLLFGRRGGARALATDDDGGGGLNSRIRQTLPADDIYVVIANVLGEDASGSYALRLETDRRVASEDAGSSSARRGALGGLLGAAASASAAATTGSERGAGTARPAPAAQLTAAEVFALPVDESRIVRMGATVQGSLAASDMKLSDNTFLDVYYFNGFQGDRVSVTLKSRAFDAYLHFGELGGAAAIATDDDSGGGRDARVSVTLPRTGTYVIIANALSTGGTGAYTLEVRSP